jgi:serine protease SohB
VEFLSEYGIFLAKAVTIVVAVLLIIAAAGGAATRSKKAHQKEMRVEKLNERFDEYKENLEQFVLDKEALKAQHKEQKKKDKEEAKKRKGKDKVSDEERKKRIFVLDFDGDIKASAVETFRESVTSVLQIADPKKDEVVVRLESPGGMVHSYGLAAAQLDRLRNAGLPLTACVDKVAASGGYMMACVADKIVASPFAIMGSIGVVAQMPNFNRLLKKNEIDFEVLTAGEHKRTLTMFGENTEKGRQKFQEDLEDTHELFKSYVAERRPQIDIDAVANGDIWFGTRALENNLVDELSTSDDYLLSASREADVFSVEFKEKQNLGEKLGISVSGAMERSFDKLLQSLSLPRSFR